MRHGPTGDHTAAAQKTQTATKVKVSTEAEPQIPQTGVNCIGPGILRLVPFRLL